MIDYKPFYMTLSKKRISQYKLKKDFYISSSILARIKNNQYVNLKTIEDLMHILKCDVDDIVRFTD